ncbi:MAG: hypothetical protein IPN01_26265 [Deltaproteobacteria bacterium]|nr:hypothetical protein [Deltaproteobacteria bacterium]
MAAQGLSGGVSGALKAGEVEGAVPQQREEQARDLRRPGGLGRRRGPEQVVVHRPTAQGVPTLRRVRQGPGLTHLLEDEGPRCRPEARRARRSGVGAWGDGAVGLSTSTVAWALPWCIHKTRTDAGRSYRAGGTGLGRLQVRPSGVKSWRRRGRSKLPVEKHRCRSSSSTAGFESRS